MVSRAGVKGEDLLGNHSGDPELSLRLLPPRWLRNGVFGVGRRVLGKARFGSFPSSVSDPTGARLVLL